MRKLESSKCTFSSVDVKGWGGAGQLLCSLVDVKEELLKEGSY